MPLISFTDALDFFSHTHKTHLINSRKRTYCYVRKMEKYRGRVSLQIYYTYVHTPTCNIPIYIKYNTTCAARGGEMRGIKILAHISYSLQRVCSGLQAASCWWYTADLHLHCHYPRCMGNCEEHPALREGWGGFSPPNPPPQLRTLIPVPVLPV